MKKVLDSESSYLTQDPVSPRRFEARLRCNAGVMEPESWRKEEGVADRPKNPETKPRAAIRLSKDGCGSPRCGADDVEQGLNVGCAPVLLLDPAPLPLVLDSRFLDDASMMFLKLVLRERARTGHLALLRASWPPEK
jgi:hypothetical protein